MSAPANGAFAAVLRDLDRGMVLPIPDRVRILTELESDLEELMDRLVDDGFAPEEARTKALEALVPDAATLRELDRLHTPLYRRLTRRLSSRKVRLAERSALIAVTGLVLALQTATLLRANLLRDPSPFLIPVLVAGAFLSALVLWKVFRFWIKKDHIQPGRGLGTILGGSGGILGLGVVGMIWDLFRTVTILEGSPELGAPLTYEWLVRSSALLSVAIILAMAGGLAWFVLSQWLTSVSEARRELLGLGSSAQSEGDEKNAR